MLLFNRFQPALIIASQTKGMTSSDTLVHLLLVLCLLATVKLASESECPALTQDESTKGVCKQEPSHMGVYMLTRTFSLRTCTVAIMVAM